MNSLSILIPLLLSGLLGLTGYLKDMKEDNIGGRRNALLGGARTLFLMSLSGLISGAVYVQGLNVFSLIFSLTVVTFVLIFYAVTANKDENSSFSDELSAIIAHALSFLWVSGTLPQSVLLAAFVATIFILEQRDALVSLGKKVSTREASEIVAFLAIALIILPFLPNVTYSLAEIGFHPELLGFTGEKIQTVANIALLNPYKIWFIVVFVSGIDIVGFLLKKIFAEGGDEASDILPAIVGGFVSSTTMTIVLAGKSAKVKRPRTLAAGAVLASVSSFFSLFAVVAATSYETVSASLLFLVGMAIGGSVYSYVLLKNKNGKRITAAEKSVNNLHSISASDKGDIFNLGPALKFAILLTAVKVISSISIVVVGATGFILTSMIASLSGVDAVAITLGDLVNAGTVSLNLAVFVFIMINAVNLISKAVYSKVSGSKEFYKYFSWGVLAMLATGILLHFVGVVL